MSEKLVRLFDSERDLTEETIHPYDPALILKRLDELTAEVKKLQYSLYWMQKCPLYKRCLENTSKTCENCQGASDET